MSKIKEFITPDGSVLKSKMPPNIDPKTTSHLTTDKYMKMVAQPFVFANYRRYYGESVLPYNEEADKLKDNPGKFYEYLKDKKSEATFEQYFVNDDPKAKLKEIAKNKAIDIIEDIITKRNILNGDFVKKDSELPSIDEIRGKEKLILDKLDRIAQYIKSNLADGEKKVILSYFNDLMNG